MPLINWDQSCSVGVKEIDTQHRAIFEIINRLYALMQANKDSESLSSIVQELMDYARYHFSTEEKYFDQFHYPDKETHIKAHHTYKEKVSQFVKDYANSKTVLSFDIIDFLEDWWLDHIKGLDKQYTDCFHNHGLY